MLLVSCGKPSQRPSLSDQRSPHSFENFLIGRRLTQSDAKAILKKLNQEGEWESLVTWVDSLSEAQFQNYIDFFNQWIFEDANTHRGLLAIISRWIEEKRFSFFAKKFSPVLLEEMNPQGKLFDLIENLSPALQPELFAQFPSFFFFQPEILLADLDRLLDEPEKSHQVELAFQSLIRSRVWNGLQGSGLEDLVSKIPENREHIEKALQIVQLLNRPSDQIASAFQQGLKNNPDLFQTLTLKWNPFFVKILSRGVVEVLLAPEDGALLDKKFWVSLPRLTTQSPPTESFIRLYSLVFSGLSKISDPTKSEPQMDSGTYRFPLQVSALYLTRLLEEILHQNKATVEGLSSENFSVDFWDQKFEHFDWAWDLSATAAKKDLKALGLDTTLDRLESLLAQKDSGATLYTFSDPLKNLSIRDIFTSALALSHQIRPLSDINPVLWIWSQSLSEVDFLKTSPNLFSQIQGVLTQLSTEQWQSLYHFLFEELNLASLEMEDRMLIVSIFQSDPEVAEWVALVLENLSAIPNLESNHFLSVYLKVIQKLSTKEQAHLGQLLSLISELGIFKVNEDGEAFYPGFQAMLEDTEVLQKNFKSLASCPPEVLNYLVMKTKMDENFPLYRLFFPLLKKMAVMDWSSFKISSQELDWGYHFIQDDGLKELKKLQLQNAPWNDFARLVQTKDFSKGMWLLSFIQNERMKEVATVFRNWSLSGELQPLLDFMQRFSKEPKK